MAYTKDRAFRGIPDPGLSAPALRAKVTPDELGGSAAIVLGAVAVLVFALTKPAAWLIGKIIEWIVVLLRRVSTLIPWRRISAAPGPSAGVGQPGRLRRTGGTHDGWARSRADVPTGAAWHKGGYGGPCSA